MVNSYSQSLLSSHCILTLLYIKSFGSHIVWRTYLHSVHVVTWCFVFTYYVLYACIKEACLAGLHL